MNAQSQNIKKASLTALAIGIALLATQLSACARGGGYYHEPKEVRQAGLWYGDAFVSEEDKKATYANYHGSSRYYGTPNTDTLQPSQGWGNAAAATQVPRTGAHQMAQPAQFSGPAYVGPDNYHYFVQEYDWNKH